MTFIPASSPGFTSSQSFTSSNNLNASAQTALHLLSESEKKLISDLKSCVDANLNISGMSKELRDSIQLRRKTVGDSFPTFIKQKLSNLLRPQMALIASTPQNIGTFLGFSTETVDERQARGIFEERFMLFDLVNLLVRTAHNYAVSIREDSHSMDTPAIVDMEGKDAENSWKTMFLLMVFDIFFEEEEENGPSSPQSTVFSQILNRLSFTDKVLSKEFITDFDLYKPFVDSERLYLVEIAFHCASKLVPLNMKEWELFLTTVSQSILIEGSLPQKLLLFAVSNALTFHSPYKPMYDLVRSRLPQRQDYLSSQDQWNRWREQMENWISTFLWSDILFKCLLSLGWSLFLRMSREVRSLKGNLLPANETPSGSFDLESSVSDRWAFEGIEGEKSLLNPQHQMTIFSMLTARCLPSTPSSSTIAAWSLKDIETNTITLMWDYYICESIKHLIISIITWGSMDWIRPSTRQPTDGILSSFCELIGCLYWFIDIPIQSTIDRRRRLLPLDSSIESFWESEKAIYFIRFVLTSVRPSSSELSVAVLHMLTGLSQGPVSSMFAFEMLQNPSSFSSSTALSWINLFTALERYQLALALESGQISPSEISAIESMLMLLITICKFQPSLITKLLVSDSCSGSSTNLAILFGIVGSKVPTSLKAHILILLSEWMASTTEGPTNASLVWAHLESSQIVPTLTMDAQLIDSISIEDEIISQFSNFNGILHELYNVEAPIGTYPVTISLIRLLSALISQDTDLLSSLGVGIRRKPGLWPYLKFIVGGCLIPLCMETSAVIRLGFLSAEEKLILVGETLSILTKVIENKIYPNLYNGLCSSGIVNVLLGIGTIPGEILGLPSLEMLPDRKDECDSTSVRSLVDVHSNVPYKILKFLYVLLTHSHTNIFEEMIVVNRPQFLSVLSQVISTSDLLEVVEISLLLLKELLSAYRVDSVLRSALGIAGMDKFSNGLARWFGQIFILGGEADTTNNDGGINRKILSIRLSILSLLSSQIEMPGSELALSTSISINTSSLLLGLNKPQEEPRILLRRLVDNLINGDLTPSSLLFLLIKTWEIGEILRNAGAMPVVILEAIERFLEEMFICNPQAIPSSLSLVGDGLYFISWLVRRIVGGVDALSQSEKTIYSILSQLLCIVPSSNLMLSTESFKSSQARDFLEGHLHAIMGISLLVPEPKNTVVDLIVDALNEKGKLWSVGIVNVLLDILSRGLFVGGSFVKLVSLFSTIAPKSISDFALGRLFFALSAALKKETMSIKLPSVSIDNLTTAILNNLTSGTRFEEASRLAITLLLDSRKYPSAEAIGSSLLSKISTPSKIEELVKFSLIQAETNASKTASSEFIASLFLIFKNNTQTLSTFVQLLSQSGYLSYIHNVITRNPSSPQYLPLLEIAASLIENAALVGASSSVLLRTNLGKLVSIPIENIRKDNGFYECILAIRIATCISSSISLASQHSMAEIKTVTSFHSKCIKLLHQFTEMDSKDSEDALELLAVLISYLLTAHSTFSTFSHESTINGIVNEKGALFSPSLHLPNVGENTGFIGILSIGVLFPIIDMLLDHVKKRDVCIVGLEQTLMLLWLTISALTSQPQTLPSVFFTDLREILSPKFALIASIEKHIPRLQYSMSMTNEIKAQFFSK